MPTLPEVGVWLSARQCHEERSQLKKAAEGCEWGAVFVDPIFTGWMQRDGKQILWPYGPPGCGKSFLYSRLTEHICGVAHKNLVYFLFCEADRARTTTMSLFRSWTFQLIKLIWRSDEASEGLQRIRHRLMYRTTREATPDEVMDLLLAILHACDTPDCFLTADGLDECTDAKEFYALLPQIPARFKVLATSQNPPPECSGEIAAHIAEIPITAELSHGEVMRYLNVALPRLSCPDGSPLPECTLTKAHATLSRAADGMLLWTRLMVEHMATQTTASAMVACLDDLPRTLSRRYNRIMDSIDAQPDAQCRLARGIFFWVLTARVPLSVQAVCTALAVGRDCPSAALAERVCGGLVRPRRDPGAGELYPFHTSVTRYLRQWAEGVDLTGEMTRFYRLRTRPGVMSADGVAAAVCMQRLALGGEDDGCRFLRYAAECWHVHAASCTEGDDAVLDLAEGYLGPHEDLSWVKLSGGEDKPEGFLGLHVAAYYGLEKVARRLLLDTRADPGSTDEQGKTPLWYALNRGHIGVAKLLMETGAEKGAEAAFGICSSNDN